MNSETGDSTQKKRCGASRATALTEADAAQVKGMLLRGDSQHRIAFWFDVNPGRIAEVATGARFAQVPVAALADLPPAGPYLPVAIVEANRFDQ